MEKHVDIDELQAEFGCEKQIPEKYEYEILVALSHYPELKYQQINFVLTASAPFPLATRPAVASFLLPKKQRVYTITILEWAKDPQKEALFKNIDLKMRIAVLGRELAHVLQYIHLGVIALIKTTTLMAIQSHRRKFEREADKLTIEHGLGEELLRHAEYIRLIPDYIERRPELKENYLLPSEIAYYITHYKLTHVSQ